MNSGILEGVHEEWFDRRMGASPLEKMRDMWYTVPDSAENEEVLLD